MFLTGKYDINLLKFPVFSFYFKQRVMTWCFWFLKTNLWEYLTWPEIHGLLAMFVTSHSG